MLTNNHQHFDVSVTMPHTTQRIGIDIGGTKIEGVLINEHHEILQRYTIPSRRGQEAVVDDITAVAKQLSPTAVPIGIGIPGQVDWQHGIVENVVNLDITRLELGTLVSKQYGAPVHVENDVNAAALGAAALANHDHALCKDPHNTLVFLNVGTGLAAGIVRNKHIVHGCTGSIGEIGHLPIDPNQFNCPCGQRGCLETVASGGALQRLWPSQTPPLPDMIRKAQQGNSEACRILNMVLHALADAVQIIMQAHDPQLIMLGGGVMKTGQSLMDLLQKELDNRASVCPFLQGLQMNNRLFLLPSDQPIGALGAALA